MTSNKKLQAIVDKYRAKLLRATLPSEVEVIMIEALKEAIKATKEPQNTTCMCGYEGEMHTDPNHPTKMQCPSCSTVYTKHIMQRT